MARVIVKALREVSLCDNDYQVGDVAAEVDLQQGMNLKTLAEAIKNNLMGELQDEPEPASQPAEAEPSSSE